jgi:hypothetical protein
MSTSEAIAGIKSARDIPKNGSTSNRTLPSKQPDTVIPPEKNITKTYTGDNAGDEELIKQAVRDYCKVRLL